MSLTGDKTGIAGVWIVSKDAHTGDGPPSRELHFRLAFSVSVKAPKGYQVSFEKNRQFLYWLKDQGFRLRAVSSDTFQSADLGQTLLAKGYDYSVISVDRVDTDHICKPYQYFQSAIYEGRLEVYEDCKLLTEEVVSLERNNTNGKIDHPTNGSKDASDAVCGAIWNASQHAEEFAYEYGEELKSMFVANADSADSLDINKAFEQELNNILDPMTRGGSQMLERAMQSAKSKQDTINQASQQKRATVNTNYVSEGILVW